MIKIALRKEYEKFVEKSKVPMFIYIHETGKIIAMSESAKILTTNDITTVRQYLNTEIELQQNAMIYNVSVYGGDVNKKFDCELNTIRAEDKHYVICCMYETSKCVKALDTPLFRPIIYWNYVDDKVTLYNETAGNNMFNQWVKENISKLNLLKTPEVSDLYSRDEINRVNEQHLQIINNRKGKFDIVKMIDFSHKKIFGKYQKIPLVNEDGKVIVIITMLNQFIGMDDYNVVINNIINEKNMAEELSDFSDNIYITFDTDDFSIKYISPNISRFGYNIREFYSNIYTVLDIVHEEYVEGFIQHVGIAKNTGLEGKILPYRFVFMDKINGSILVESDVILKHKADGKTYINWLIKFDNNIINNLPRFDMDEASKQLIESYSVMNKVINTVDLMIFILDENFTIIRVNDNVKKTYQNRVNEKLVGENIYDFFSKSKIYHYASNKSNQEKYSKKMEGYCFDSVNEVYYRYSVKKIELITVVTLSDITEFILDNNEFTNKAELDLLTNIKNRIAYDIDIISAIRTAQSTKKKSAVIVFDINEFNIIYQKFGYELCNNILIILAENLNASEELSEKSYRLCGDVFSIIVEEESNVRRIIKELKEISKKIRLEIKQGVSFSFGVCVFTGHDVSGNVILENARIALAKAKESGRGRIVFYSKSMMDKKTEKNDNAAFMEDFFKKENGRLKVLYHPIFSEGTGGKTYIRPVVSFVDNNGNKIKPLKIVSIKDYPKTVKALDNYLYKNSFLISSKVNNISPSNCVVTIKLSVIKMIEEGFLEEIKEMIKITDVDVESVSFELSELFFGEHEYYIRKVITIMGEMGLRIGIKGFKKEYIYLDNIFEFPLNYIKLGEECFRIIIEGKGDYKNIISFIEKARKLNVRVITEDYGVEDAREKLNSIGLEDVEVYTVLDEVDETTLLNFLEKNKNGAK